jgi:hypothetical protein
MGAFISVLITDLLASDITQDNTNTGGWIEGMNMLSRHSIEFNSQCGGKKDDNKGGSTRKQESERPFIVFLAVLSISVAKPECLIKRSRVSEERKDVVFQEPGGSHTQRPVGTQPHGGCQLCQECQGAA